jgi:hypothetical protein
MELDHHASLLVRGAVFGLLAALAGGLADYRLRLRRAEPAQRGPALLLIVGGLLMLCGLIALVTSLITTGGVRPAVVLGVGVGIGFNLGFVLLVLFYFVRRGG